jgi:hypothetical protein
MMPDVDLFGVCVCGTAAGAGAAVRARAKSKDRRAALDFAEYNISESKSEIKEALARAIFGEPKPVSYERDDLK